MKSSCCYWNAISCKHSWIITVHCASECRFDGPKWVTDLQQLPPVKNDETMISVFSASFELDISRYCQNVWSLFALPEHSSCWYSPSNRSVANTMYQHNVYSACCWFETNFPISIIKYTILDCVWMNGQFFFNDFTCILAASHSLNRYSTKYVWW